MSIIIRFSWTDTADRTVALPSYATAGSAGADMRANLADRGEVTLAPGTRFLIPTGLRMAIPAGYEVQLRPRSGLAFKHGLTLLNTPGTIDSDYRGEVQILMINLGTDPVTLSHGERIAQAVVASAPQATFALADLDDTGRGQGGFGSTGRS